MERKFPVLFIARWYHLVKLFPYTDLELKEWYIIILIISNSFPVLVAIIHSGPF